MTPATNADRVACVETVTQLPATMTPVLSPLVIERPVPGHHPRPVDAVRRLARALLVDRLALGPFATSAAQ